MSDETLWWITLGGGLVVALLVWFLLEWLRRTVKGIDERVQQVWIAGTKLAQNTQVAHLLDTSTQRGREVVDELRRDRA